MERVTECEEIAVGGEEDEFALAVGLVDGAVYVALGQSVEFRLQFGIELIDVAYIDVVSETPGTGGAASGPVCSPMRKAAVSRWT